MNKVKQSVTSGVTTTRTVVFNAAEFFNAACLVAVSVYAIMQSLENRDSVWHKLLFVAGAVILLQGAALLVKHFNKPVK